MKLVKIIIVFHVLCNIYMQLLFYLFSTLMSLEDGCQGGEYVHVEVYMVTLANSYLFQQTDLFFLRDVFSTSCCFLAIRLPPSVSYWHYHKTAKLPTNVSTTTSRHDHVKVRNYLSRTNSSLQFS